MLTCTRCLASKLEGDFPPSKQRLSGYGSQCKACRAAQSREARARSRGIAPKSERHLVSVPDASRDISLGEFGIELEADLAALTEPLERTVVALLRRIAHDLDVDDHSNPAIGLNLYSQLRATMKEAGMTPGPRKPKVEAEPVKPTLSIASF